MQRLERIACQWMKPDARVDLPHRSVSEQPEQREEVKVQVGLEMLAAFGSSL